MVSESLFFETVQIDPFLIDYGHDGRREDSQLRKTTERSPGATEGSNGAVARNARAIEAGPGADRRVGKAENASTPFREGKQEEAKGRGEEAAPKA